MENCTLINYWYEFKKNNPGKLKARHMELYFFIINTWSSIGFPEQFGLPTSHTIEALEIGSYNTYKSTLNELIDFGLLRLFSKSLNQYHSKIIGVVNPDFALSKNDMANNCAISKNDTANRVALSKIDTPKINGVSKNDMAKINALSKNDEAPPFALSKIDSILWCSNNNINNYQHSLDNKNKESENFEKLIVLISSQKNIELLCMRNKCSTDEYKKVVDVFLERYQDKISKGLPWSYFSKSFPNLLIEINQQKNNIKPFPSINSQQAKDMI